MTRKKSPLQNLDKYLRQFKQLNKGIGKHFKSVDKKVITLFSVVIVVVLGAVDYWQSESPAPTTQSVVRPKGEYFLQGKITHVADGDTVNIYVNGVRERVRLANIDAPETGGRSDRPGQLYGDESQQALEAMVLNKTLTLHCFEQDHYGRNVCNIPLSNGQTANQLLVEQGWAWAYTGSGGRYLRDKSLVNIQKQASQAKLGLWQQQNPIAPWVWRVQCWQKKQCKE